MLPPNPGDTPAIQRPGALGTQRQRGVEVGDGFVVVPKPQTHHAAAEKNGGAPGLFLANPAQSGVAVLQGALQILSEQCLGPTSVSQSRAQPRIVGMRGDP